MLATLHRAREHACLGLFMLEPGRRAVRNFPVLADRVRGEVRHGYEISFFKGLGPFWGVIQRKQTFLGKPDRLLKV